MCSAFRLDVCWCKSGQSNPFNENYYSPPSSPCTITRYQAHRSYGADDLDDQFAEVLPGPYTVRTPSSDGITEWASFSLDHILMIEAWPGRGPTPDPNSWKLLSPAAWQNEALKLDASIRNQFSWQGFSPSSMFASTIILFSIVDESTGQVVFPSYPDETPEEDRLPMDLAPYATSVEIGAGIVPAGTRGVARIEVARNFGTDKSRRTFEWIVEFLGMPNNRELFADMSVPGMFRFNAAAGLNYKIESSGNLKNWDVEEVGIPGTGGSVIRIYPTESVEKRFFRARRE